MMKPPATCYFVLILRPTVGLGQLFLVPSLVPGMVTRHVLLIAPCIFLEAMKKTSTNFLKMSMC